MKLRKQSHIWLFNSCTYMCTHPHTHTHLETHTCIRAQCTQRLRRGAVGTRVWEAKENPKTAIRLLCGHKNAWVTSPTSSVSQSVSPSLRMSVCQLPSVIIISQVPWSLAKQMQSKLNIGLCPAWPFFPCPTPPPLPALLPFTLLPHDHPLGLLLLPKILCPSGMLMTTSVASSLAVGRRGCYV